MWCVECIEWDGREDGERANCRQYITMGDQHDINLANAIEAQRVIITGGQPKDDRAYEYLLQAAKSGEGIVQSFAVHLLFLYREHYPAAQEEMVQLVLSLLSDQDPNVRFLPVLDLLQLRSTVLDGIAQLHNGKPEHYDIILNALFQLISSDQGWEREKSRNAFRSVFNSHPEECLTEMKRVLRGSNEKVRIAIFEVIQKLRWPEALYEELEEIFVEEIVTRAKLSYIDTVIVSMGFSGIVDDADRALHIANRLFTDYQLPRYPPSLELDEEFDEASADVVILGFTIVRQLAPILQTRNDNINKYIRFFIESQDAITLLDESKRTIMYRCFYEMTKVCSDKLGDDCVSSIFKEFLENIHSQSEAEKYGSDGEIPFAKLEILAYGIIQLNNVLPDAVQACLKNAESEFKFKTRYLLRRCQVRSHELKWILDNGAFRPPGISSVQLEFKQCTNLGVLTLEFLKEPRQWTDTNSSPSWKEVSVVERPGNGIRLEMK